MDNGMSCCGVNCLECGYYPSECPGCSEIRGKVFWLEYTGGEVCEIYRCCVEERRLPHCGGCPQLPCAFFQESDPIKTEEENERDFQEQMMNLWEMNRQGG